MRHEIVGVNNGIFDEFLRIQTDKMMITKNKTTTQTNTKSKTIENMVMITMYKTITNTTM